MRLYEAMFVVDSALAEREWDAVQKEIETTIAKHGGKVADLRKWDDRRLAYEVRRMKRALYILVHFEAPTAAIEPMRRDLVLSERIVRNLITVDIDGIPVGDDRPGITSSAVPDFGQRPHEGRGRGEERGEGAAAEAVVEEVPRQ